MGFDFDLVVSIIMATYPGNADKLLLAPAELGWLGNIKIRECYPPHFGAIVLSAREWTIQES